MTRRVRKILIGLSLLAGALLSSCSDYNACEALALRICEECPDVSRTWQAACQCIQYDSLKEEGFKCVEHLSSMDEKRCHATLENWDAHTCGQLN